MVFTFNACPKYIFRDLGPDPLTGVSIGVEGSAPDLRSRNSWEFKIPGYYYVWFEPVNKFGVIENLVFRINYGNVKYERLYSSQVFSGSEYRAPIGQMWIQEEVEINV